MFPWDGSISNILQPGKTKFLKLLNKDAQIYCFSYTWKNMSVLFLMHTGIKIPNHVFTDYRQVTLTHP